MSNELCEPIAVQDIFASGVLDAENIGGGCFRLTFYTHQRSIHGGEPERIIAARLILPAVALKGLSRVATMGAAPTLVDLEPATAVFS